MIFNIISAHLRSPSNTLMPTSDPRHDAIAELTHDHSQLSALVIAVGSVLQRVQSEPSTMHDVVDELGGRAELLREGLLAHFAREEEALFPFVDRQLPALKDRIRGLIADHDAVVRAAAELARAATQMNANAESGVAQCVSSFESFEQIYAEHAKMEHTFLADVDAALDDEARATLRTVLNQT